MYEILKAKFFSLDVPKQHSPCSSGHASLILRDRPSQVAAGHGIYCHNCKLLGPQHPWCFSKLLPFREGKIGVF